MSDPPILGGADGPAEWGRMLPPYGGITRCAGEHCRQDLTEEVGAYLHRNLDDGKLYALCGPCSRQAELTMPHSLPKLIL